MKLVISLCSKDYTFNSVDFPRYNNNANAFSYFVHSKRSSRTSIRQRFPWFQLSKDFEPTELPT